MAAPLTGKPPRVNLGRLTPETVEQRAAKAHFGPADQERVRTWGAGITARGVSMTPEGQLIMELPGFTHAFFNGQNDWLRAELRWVRADGQLIPEENVKAAVEALYSQATAEIGGLATELTNGRLTAQSIYEAMQETTKRGHGAAASLARGGVENMTPKDWDKVSKIIEREWNGQKGKFPGLRAFGEDLTKGRYGTTSINGMASQRATHYAHQFRITYESTRADVAWENGEDEVIFLLGAADHCPGCMARAARGYIPKDDPEANSMGDKECGSKCKCVEQFKQKHEKVLNSEVKAQDRAKGKLEAYNRSKAEKQASKEDAAA